MCDLVGDFSVLRMKLIGSDCAICSAKTNCDGQMDVRARFVLHVHPWNWSSSKAMDREQERECIPEKKLGYYFQKKE